jgi:hypothetical protein
MYCYYVCVTIENPTHHRAWDIKQGSPPLIDQPASSSKAYLNVDMHRVDQVVRSLMTNLIRSFKKAMLTIPLQLKEISPLHRSSLPPRMGW